jgi:hypothetical protein
MAPNVAQRARSNLAVALASPGGGDDDGAADAAEPAATRRVCSGGGARRGRGVARACLGRRGGWKRVGGGLF